MNNTNSEHNKKKELSGDVNSTQREKYEIPSIMFVPVKIEERLMQADCNRTAGEFHCSEPFKLS